MLKARLAPREEEAHRLFTPEADLNVSSDDGQDLAEPATLFQQGTPAVRLPYERVRRERTTTLARVDRGSRAETVSYGGGLRATSRRIAVAFALGAVLLVVLGAVVYLVNAETVNRYSAAVVPAGVVPLNFAVTRPLSRILVKPGQRVHRGEILAEQEDIAAGFEISEAKLAITTDEQRLSYLRDALAATPLGGSPSDGRQRALLDAQISETETSGAFARVKLAAAEASVQSTLIRSPLNGTVLRTAGAPGELVGPDGVKISSLLGLSLPAFSAFRLFPSATGTSTNLSDLSEPVVSVVQGRRWQVAAEVPETVISQVLAGESATFQFDTLGGQSLPAVVHQVVDVPFQVNGQVNYEVLLSLKGRVPPGVLPGMSGIVSLG